MALQVTIISGLFLLLYLICLSSHAEQIRYPVPCYEGEELDKVRQWEKQWVGKKINSTNIHKVKEFIPESLFQIVKDPETWGEGWFEIVPYREIRPSKGDIEFTRKHAGICSIGSDEKLYNYVSGIPFPNPKTGLEIAYNFESLNQGDSMNGIQEVLMTNLERRYDRKMVMSSHMVFFTGRREVPPVPEILPNDSGIHRASHAAYQEPASMRGTRSLMIKWKDRSKDFASWSWSSSTRKIVRRSTAQRQNTQGGADMIGEDNMIYDNAIFYMNYKYLGRKDVLLPRHQDIVQVRKGHREGYCVPYGTQRERVKTYRVECTHKNPNYIYSKQIWNVDPETWWIIYAEKYDKQGRLWRIFDNAGYVLKSVYNNELIGATGFTLIIDVQRLHATNSFIKSVIGETGEYYEPEYFTPKALQKYGY